MLNSCFTCSMLNITGHPPGSLPSDTWLALPPREPTTCLAAAISSSLAPTPRHTNRALGDFSTNTSLVFRLEAEAVTCGNKCRPVRGGNKESLHTMCCTQGHRCTGHQLTSTARVAWEELFRMWKRRVLLACTCPPLRDVPPLWMIMGLPWNRLIRWGGSWPWVTLTCGW